MASDWYLCPRCQGSGIEPGDYDADCRECGGAGDVEVEV
jgi:DnaJ-class molecular chaperone